MSMNKSYPEPTLLNYNDSMIIVTGSVQARPDTLDEVVRLSLEHVHRSRR